MICMGEMVRGGTDAELSAYIQQSRDAQRKRGITLASRVLRSRRGTWFTSAADERDIVGRIARISSVG